MKIAFTLSCGVLAVLIGPVGLSVDAFAQAEVIRPGGVLPSAVAGPMEPADRLAMNLRLLSQNPYDVNALTQAGESALAVGDPNAAVSFLARAEELSPANGRIKADLASALVLLERPAEAFRLFGEAESLGIPAQSFAKDRGLAYDLRGDPKRAQADYALALRRGNDDETIKRMALSLGISGDKDQALRQLEPLTRKRDQGAWRARAFILAMNGDVRGAERIAEQVVPPAMMTGLSTFLHRLPALSAAQRAAAVNFGSMPSQDVRYASVQSSDPFRPIEQSAADILNPPSVVAVPEPLIPEPAKGKRDRAQRTARASRPEQQVALSTPVTLRTVNPALQPSQAQQSPSPAAEAAIPSWNDTRLSRRVGERIGPVDPSRLPPEARGAVPAGLQSPMYKPVVQVGMAQLPPPDAITTRAPVITNNGPPNSSLISAPPVFEIPAAPAVTPVKPAPPLVTAPAPMPTPMPAPQIVVQPVMPAVAPALVTPVVQALPVVSAPAGASVPAPPIATSVVAPVVPEPRPVVAAPAPGIAPVPGFSDPIAAPPAAASVPPVSAPQLIGPPAPESVQVPATVSPPQAATLETTEIVPPTVTALPPAPKPEATGLGAILADLTPEDESRAGPVMSDAEFRRARIAAKRKADLDAQAASNEQSEDRAAALAKEREEEEQRQLAARSPQRIWVQVATGARRDGLPVTMKKLRDQAPDALKGIGSATAPFKATNRLLVGPFKSQSDARSMVNKLAKQGISATTFTSDAGQEVSKVGR